MEKLKAFRDKLQAAWARTEPFRSTVGGVCGKIGNVIRVIWNMVAVPMNPNIYTVSFSYPLTWTITSIAFAVYYWGFSSLKKNILGFT